MIADGPSTVKGAPGRPLPMARASDPRDRRERPHEVLEGRVTGVVFCNPDTGFAVVRLLTGGAEVTAAGDLAPVHEGEELRLHGRWEEHARFGLQFRAAWAERTTPTTRDGLVRYLGGGAFPGIGPDLARRLVDHFGDATLDALERGEEALREVPGIGAKRARALAEAYREDAARHRVLAELRGFGLTGGQAATLYERWGPEAPTRVVRDPWALIEEVHGIGFQTAERIAHAAGVPLDSMERARGVALHLLREATREGHACLPERVVWERLLDLGCSEEVVAEAVADLLARARIVREELPSPEDPSLYLPELHAAEAGVAAHLARLARGAHGPLADEAALARALARSGLTPDDSQRRALELALAEPVAVMTGGPGTGKTTTLRVLLDLLEDRGVGPVRLASPTGRAARRLQDATGREASTLHRLLGWDPVANAFRHHADEPLELAYLVVDEVSMLDLPLAASVLAAVPDGARVLFVGDADQLPSVGPGAVLADLVAAPEVPTVRLSRIHRQGEGSAIVEAAHAVLQGEAPRSRRTGGSGDFFVVEIDDPDEAAAMVERIVAERIPEAYGLDPMQDVLVLAPMYRGPLGVDELNRRLAERLNPGPAEGPPWAKGLRVGDRVMVVRNDYDREVFNGDTGRVVRLTADTLTVEVDGRLHDYGPPQLDDLVPAWCVTVHRAQGTEARAVVVALASSHYLMLRRNLLYTAVTRGRDLVVVVSSRGALWRAVRNDEERHRLGNLRHRLARALAASS